MTPEQKSYLPAIAEHAKKWVELSSTGLRYIRAHQIYPLAHLRETELLQLMQWIEERERLNWCNEKQGHNYFITLTSIVGLEELTASARWHERWLAICQVKGWKTTL